MGKLLLSALSLFIASCAVAAEQKHWALLVAGSNGYMNYRHQSDVCHAYHILHKQGIPDEQIVVMMYDDIANNPQNPFPGNIINRPNGPNVYPGVLKDYTGRDVNPDVFLKVLTGDKAGVKQLTGKDGKVIASGPDDTVFVYFTDHGGPGLIAFPDYSVLNAKPLNDALVKMHKNKQFKELVFYLEACESGSMFNTLLPKDINIFVTTAANPDESSYACYYDKTRHTYLGDLYSVNWMEDSDRENLNHETLQKQFTIVKQKTNSSHVMEYGDLKLKNQVVGHFQGKLPLSSQSLSSGGHFVDPNLDAVKAEDVELRVLEEKLADAEGEEIRVVEDEIRKVLKTRSETLRMFRRIVRQVSSIDYSDLFRQPVEFSSGFDCYEGAVDTLIDMCPGLRLTNNYHALKHLRVLANACDNGVPQQKLTSFIRLVASRSSICHV